MNEDVEMNNPQNYQDWLAEYREDNEIERRQNNAGSETNERTV